MERKFLASIFSFLPLFLAVYAQSEINDIDDDSTEFELETAIYYGDSNVNIGEPFSITCIIPITDPIHWIRDGEPITRHNLRHGRDEHAYTLSESAIEGEKHKIEAHISVHHALKAHEGKYQCNNLHTTYHMLHVRNVPTTLKPLTKSPFIITAEERHLSTESVYQSVHDLTPSSIDEIFTRTWEGKEPIEEPAIPPLPTRQTVTTTTSLHHRQHHHHHHPQQQVPQEIFQNPFIKDIQDYEYHQQQKQQKQPEHKFIYINATNFDGSPKATHMGMGMGMGSSSGSDSNTGAGRMEDGGTTSDSNENLELLNIAYIPAPAPIPKLDELSTVSWQGDVRERGGGGNHFVKQSATPPQFPPPRTTTVLTLPTPITVLNEKQLHQMHHLPPNHHMEKNHHLNTANNNAGEQLEHQQTNVRFPLQTMQPIGSSGISSHGNNRHHASTGSQQIQQQHNFYQSSQPPPLLTTHYHTLMFPTQSSTISNVPHLNHIGGNKQQQNKQFIAPPLLQAETAISSLSPDLNNQGSSYTTTSWPASGSTLPASAPSSTTTFATRHHSTSTSSSSSASSASSASVALIKESHVIKPNYDNESRQLKVFEFKKPLVLNCDVPNKMGEKLKWFKDNKEITPENFPRIKIKEDEDKLTIDKGDINDDGNYTCLIGNTRREFNVVAHVQVRTHSNTGVVEGEKLQIICNVVGTSPILSWQVGNTTYTNSSNRYILKPNDKVENAIFLIENVSLEDRGEYKCMGKNDANEYAKYPVTSDTSFVRVKGKYAALWPFLGICAEVLILCLIILIYEKRRNKTELEESDTDPQDQFLQTCNWMTISSICSVYAYQCILDVERPTNELPNMD